MAYERELNIPIQIAVIRGVIFENLAKKDIAPQFYVTVANLAQKKFAVNFIKEIPVGSNLMKSWYKVMLWLLIDEKFGFMNHTREKDIILRIANQYQNALYRKYAELLPLKKETYNKASNRKKRAKLIGLLLGETNYHYLYTRALSDHLAVLASAFAIDGNSSVYKGTVFSMNYGNNHRYILLGREYTAAGYLADSILAAVESYIYSLFFTTLQYNKDRSYHKINAGHERIKYFNALGDMLLQAMIEN